MLQGSALEIACSLPFVSGNACCRWDKERPPTVDNLVLLTFEEAEAHENSNLTEVQKGDPLLFQKVMSARRQLYAELGICDQT